MFPREYKGHTVQLFTMRTDDENYVDVYVDGKLIGEESTRDKAWDMVDKHIAQLGG